MYKGNNPTQGIYIFYILTMVIAHLLNGMILQVGRWGGCRGSWKVEPKLPQPTLMGGSLLPDSGLDSSRSIFFAEVSGFQE